MLICRRNAPANLSFSWPFFIFILVSTSHGFPAAAAAAKRAVPVRSSDDFPTHYQFLKGRHRGAMTCCGGSGQGFFRPDHDVSGAGIGGVTCCFRRFCRDTRSDPNNCGGCGKTCAFGLICCGGRCVDVHNDPHHCGSCFQECHGLNRCSFAMCGYG